MILSVKQNLVNYAETGRSEPFARSPFKFTLTIRPRTVYEIDEDSGTQDRGNQLRRRRKKRYWLSTMADERMLTNAEITEQAVLRSEELGISGATSQELAGRPGYKIEWLTGCSTASTTSTSTVSSSASADFKQPDVAIDVQDRLQRQVHKPNSIDAILDQMKDQASEDAPRRVRRQQPQQSLDFCACLYQRLCKGTPRNKVGMGVAESSTDAADNQLRTFRYYQDQREMFQVPLCLGLLFISGLLLFVMFFW